MRFTAVFEPALNLPVLLSGTMVQLPYRRPALFCREMKEEWIYGRGEVGKGEGRALEALEELRAGKLCLACIV